MKTKTFLLVGLTALNMNVATNNLFAQPSDPPTPMVSTPTSCEELKTLTVAAPPTGVTYYWQGTNSSGTDTTYSASSIYTVFYQCTSSILYYVRAKSDSSGIWSMGSGSVDVGSTRFATPCNPQNPTTTNNTCGDQTLTKVGTPATDVKYYWQGTDSNGTSTSNATISYTVTATGTYYIRAYDNCSGQWSDSSGYVVSTIANPLPATPPTPTVNTPAVCNNLKTLTETAPPIGVTYYWQGTNSSGTDTTYSASSIYTVSYQCTSSIFYYVSAKSDAGCWSASSGSVDVGSTRFATPCNPQNPTTTNNTCGDQTLTKVGTPATDVKYYWQGTDSNGTSTTNNATTSYAVTTTGTYYIRAYDNCSGQWSDSSGYVVSTIANPLPATPPTPTVNTPAVCNNLKTLTETTPPTGVTYYWQGTNANGTSTTNNASSPYTVSYQCTSSIFYYISAKSDAGCWSASSGFVDVGSSRSAPCNPQNPTTTNNTCGNQTLTKVGTPATDVKYYWQGTDSNGTSTTNNATTSYTVTATGTYYIRAYDNCSGQWSDSSGYVVSTIDNPSPATPPAPVLESPSCGNQYLTITASPSGVTYYWQGTDNNGTDMSSSSSSYTVSDNCTWATYYVRAKSNVGCWSASSASPSVYECSPTPCPPCSIVASISNDTVICKGETIVLTANGGTNYLWDTGDTTSSITVTPTTNRYYNVSVSDDSCTVKATIKVNVDTMPDATITSTPGPFCASDIATTLTATDTGGVWSGTGITDAQLGIFDPTTAGGGSHQITYTISGTCGDNDNITIVVNASADATISPAGPFCETDGIISLISADGGGTWSGNGVSGSTFNPAVAGVGTHQITYLITGVCGNTDSINIIVDNTGICDTTTIGINHITIKSQQLFSIYPNPNDGNFELEILNSKLGIKNAELVIYNVLGEIVYQQEIQNPKIKIQNFRSGVYFLQLVTEKGVWSEKIIVNY